MPERIADSFCEIARRLAEIAAEKRAVTAPIPAATVTAEKVTQTGGNDDFAYAWAPY